VTSDHRGAGENPADAADRRVVTGGRGHVPTLTFPEPVAEEVSSFMTALRSGISG